MRASSVRATAHAINDNCHPVETDCAHFAPERRVRERYAALGAHHDYQADSEGPAHPSSGLVAQLNATWRVMDDPLQWRLQRSGLAANLNKTNDRNTHAYHLNQVNKLSRTYVALLEALNRHRGKGQQKVTVEHVHVHQGGQAIVGHVEHQGGGVQHKTNGSTPCVNG